MIRVITCLLLFLLDVSTSDPDHHTVSRSGPDDQCSSAECAPSKTVQLNNGVVMPLVGLGTAGLTDQTMLDQVVETAVRAGYRMVDTADLYDNHRQLSVSLSRALPKAGLTRSDMFIITKLRPTDLGMTRCRYAVPRFLEELDTPYLDLVLIHAPHIPPILSMRPHMIREKELRAETWRCLEQLQKEGLVRAIGVSNYDTEQVREVVELGGVVPQVNQVHLTPFSQQGVPVELAGELGVHLQAYSSLLPHLLHHPQVREVADKYGVSSAQLLLGWSLQRGWSVLPKSRVPDRIKENIRIDFQIDTEDMTIINNLK